MEKRKILQILALMYLSIAVSPVFALSKTPIKLAPKITKPAKISMASEPVNPLYPAKYTKPYIDSIKNEYKSIGKDEVFYVALDMLKGTKGDFSRQAILGNNLTGKPVKVEFKNLGEINKTYASYDALGWKRGSKLYIYINQSHSNSPAIALAALLSHEALHQDEYNSLSEETYAWTMEAAVYTDLLRLYPDYKLNMNTDSLVQRENTLSSLYIRGGYTNKYVKKTVYSNAGYQNLPESSPGFEPL